MKESMSPGFDSPEIKESFYKESYYAEEERDAREEAESLRQEYYTRAQSAHSEFKEAYDRAYALNKAKIQIMQEIAHLEKQRDVSSRPSIDHDEFEAASGLSPSFFEKLKNIVSPKEDPASPQEKQPALDIESMIASKKYELAEIASQEQIAQLLADAYVKEFNAAQEILKSFETTEEPERALTDTSDQLN
ncbi:MAG: hypothetical protein LRY41_00535 [Candidatus Pacebacteria bacterium]|nr:hypothetical protein [Candidatus Paceibacterota bacterium]MCD8507843.1 hypothetical protein [Candidatus Paceibacterota bacterium]MCD8527816.1 hypothetical protein [Candidatus Paceibacterota bacterium]MCD8563522.1 hypothetical protein [Candidatus Paceibacterota bacterium]